MSIQGKLTSIDIKVIDNGYLVDVQRKVESTSDKWDWDYNTTTSFYATIEEVSGVISEVLFNEAELHVS